MARPRIEFWLDTNKPDEWWLLEQIPLLKKNNLFSKFVRDGLTLVIQLHEWKLDARTVYRLLADLRDGNTDVLTELFPHIRSKIDGGGRNSWAGLGEGGAPPSLSRQTSLPQATVTEAEIDLEAIGEDFLDFIS